MKNPASRFLAPENEIELIFEKNDIVTHESFAKIAANRLRITGNQFFHENIFEKVIDAYTKAIKICSQSEAAFYNRCLRNLKLQQYESALWDETSK